MDERWPRGGSGSPEPDERPAEAGGLDYEAPQHVLTPAELLVLRRRMLSRQGKIEIGGIDTDTTEISGSAGLVGPDADPQRTQWIASEPSAADGAIDEDPGAETEPGSTPRRHFPAATAALITGRTVIALVSAAVLILTGMGWATLDKFEENLNTTDVLANVPNSPEARDGATDILLVGSDSRNDAQGNPLPERVLKQLRTEATDGSLNTDTIILLRVPDNGGKAYAISIPRDTYVNIPGFREDKINAAYGAMKYLTFQRLRQQGVTDQARIEKESDQAGRSALVQAVQDLTGLRIDHYAEVNLYGFYLLTEVVGGVEVCLKRATSDPNSGANFKAGRQTITGGDALSFVRQRDGLPRSDLDRIVRQQVFLATVANKILSAGTLTDSAKVSGLTEASRKSVVLDQGWDIIGFAQQMQGLAGGKVEFATIPVTGVGARNERGQSIITVDKKQVHEFASSLVNGGPVRTPPSGPPPTTQSPTTQGAPPSSNSQFGIDVHNATPRTNLAARVAEFLVSQGFGPGKVDNSDHRARSVVRTARGQRDLGQPVATALGGLPVEEDAKQPAGRVLVLLGGDYHGPGVQGLAAGPLLKLDGTASGQGPAQQPPPVNANDTEPISIDGIRCVY